jgi:hypothetical protein
MSRGLKNTLNEVSYAGEKMQVIELSIQKLYMPRNHILNKLSRIIMMMKCCRKLLSFTNSPCHVLLREREQRRHRCGENKRAPALEPLVRRSSDIPQEEHLDGGSEVVVELCRGVMVSLG